MVTFGGGPCTPWRLDPEDSFSDWKIVVSTVSTEKRHDEGSSPSSSPSVCEESAMDDKKKMGTSSSDDVTYHVHRNVMGPGLRGSEFFRALFRTSLDVTESKTSTSHLEHQVSAAEAFPLMLDFMYYGTAEVAASAETAVALRHLADYYGVPTLLNSVNRFIYGNMTKENFSVYLKEAELYDDDEIVSVALGFAVSAWQAEKCVSYLKTTTPQEKYARYLEILIKRLDEKARSSGPIRFQLAYCASSQPRAS